ncbi:hypothetical protein ACHAWF_008618, partial [Thalassiosira exigua]
ACTQDHVIHSSGRISLPFSLSRLSLASSFLFATPPTQHAARNDDLGDHGDDDDDRDHRCLFFRRLRLLGDLLPFRFRRARSPPPSPAALATSSLPRFARPPPSHFRSRASARRNSFRPPPPPPGDTANATASAARPAEIVAVARPPRNRAGFASANSEDETRRADRGMRSERNPLGGGENARKATRMGSRDEGERGATTRIAPRCDNQSEQPRRARACSRYALVFPYPSAYRAILPRSDPRRICTCHPLRPKDPPHPWDMEVSDFAWNVHQNSQLASNNASQLGPAASPALAFSAASIPRFGRPVAPFGAGRRDVVRASPRVGGRAAGSSLPMSSTEEAATASAASSSSSPPFVDYNAVHVAKEGGAGVRSASEMMSAGGAARGLGAPPPRPPRGGSFLTRGGVTIDADVRPLRYTHGDIDECASSDDGDCEVYVSSFFADGGEEHGLTWGSDGAIERLVDLLDYRKGALLTSSYEFPGRYARWSLGFVDPPLEVSGTGDRCKISALNGRGRVLLEPILDAMNGLRDDGTLADVVRDGDVVDVRVAPPAEVGTFSEEERSRQPSLFSVVRALVDLFGYDSDESGDLQLGLYGAFGYDLTFQFEPIRLAQERDPSQRDLVLYLADELVVVDQSRNSAWTVSLDFSYGSESTRGLPHAGSSCPFQPYDGQSEFLSRDTSEGDFSKSVDVAKGEFKVGNLFEAVLSQTFRRPLGPDMSPSRVFRRLRSRNPSPYGFFFNLGEDEYLVGASPEMFVRCEKVEDNEYRPGALRVETCPISGTVARGVDALEDAARVKSLITNLKEESELTMCTDVDRNDKSRICEPGSVKVIGRRQIEMYSRLIHTVDHVEGYLRPDFDALDAFLCHTWAVTVTGAPKTWAIQFVEDNERSPRCWYGGAVGLVGFDGSMNTGLTLRTVRVKDGIAEVRAGATLLYDSDPKAEELETELKASAMLDAIDTTSDSGDEVDGNVASAPVKGPGEGKTIILVDHEDSFVHTLGNYLRQTGAAVTTLRSGPSALRTIQKLVDDGKKPDMIVLSPGPGNPTDFQLSKTISLLEENQIPGFGVCLGLQGMVEHFGGELGVLGYPMHGKPSPVSLTESGQRSDSIFNGLPESFEVARYHSLYGLRDKLPSCLDVTALTEDGIVMGIKHKTLPYAAVQFHPESILTSPAHGMAILKNALTFLSSESEVNGS